MTNFQQFNYNDNVYRLIVSSDKFWYVEQYVGHWKSVWLIDNQLRNALHLYVSSDLEIELNKFIGNCLS